MNIEMKMYEDTIETEERDAFRLQTVQCENYPFGYGFEPKDIRG
jgi:hypothetical protein